MGHALDHSWSLKAYPFAWESHLADGSAPSDPRRTYYIGQPGHGRKPEKIRKPREGRFPPVYHDSASHKARHTHTAFRGKTGIPFVYFDLSGG